VNKAEKILVSEYFESFIDLAFEAIQAGKTSPKLVDSAQKFRDLVKKL